MVIDDGTIEAFLNDKEKEKFHKFSDDTKRNEQDQKAKSNDGANNFLAEDEENQENSSNNEESEKSKNSKDNEESEKSENSKDTKKDNEENENSSDDEPNLKPENFENEEDFIDAVMDGYDDESVLLSFCICLLNEDWLEFCEMKKKQANKIAKNQKKKKKKEWDDIDNDSELSDLEIREEDELFVLCGSDEAQEVFTCEINTFDTKLRTYFTHHEIILSTFPLCCCWLNFTPFQDSNSEQGNYLAVGTVEEGIEIYNLDVVDYVEPIAMLGGRSKKRNKVNSKTKNQDNDASQQLQSKDDQDDKDVNSEDENTLLEDEIKEYYDMNPSTRFKMEVEDKELLFGTLTSDSHEDSVLCLDWHSKSPHTLMSGGADGHLKQWDLSFCKSVKTWSYEEYHKGKIQCLRIHPIEWNLVLSGSTDKTIRLCDTKSSNSKIWNFFHCDIESLQWHPRTPTMFVAGLENGKLVFVDFRKEDKPLLEIELSAFENTNIHVII
ncbi:hypothetical protein RFI_24356 [Reticulomyxa filosa]|uniref:Uncharacterized protein n=1 Tax=Reticulomyxa filosa TaxID=46433 RepID=X6MG68_RETFI|nr:hypothetical protein RFI_24356 [Reticulomyxa filosa]|eukprot:ETO13018.1 hypothetical protein RFI_24356 [Reticulomyxa filosa]